MLYLLTLGWPWFAAAAALGVAIGFATSTRTQEGEFSGRWVIALAIILLAALGGAAQLGVVQGRDALLLEVTFLASLAYFLGLPLGGEMKAMAPHPAPASVKPTAVILRGAPASAPRPAETVEAPVVAPSEPEPALEQTFDAPVMKPVLAPVLAPAEVEPLGLTEEKAPETPTPDVRLVDAPPPVEHEAEPVTSPAPRSEPLRPPPPAAGDGKGFPGRPPLALSAPRNGRPDDLTRIKGVGPKSVEKLHRLGVYHFDQIAAWTIDEARYVGAALSVPGRVERGKWVQQARNLTAGGDGEK